jgi:hypothetical protein
MQITPVRSEDWMVCDGLSSKENRQTGPLFSYRKAWLLVVVFLFISPAGV